MAAYAGWPVSVENTPVRQLEQGFKKEGEGEGEGLQATGSTSGAAKVRVWLILQNAIYGVQIHEGGGRGSLFGRSVAVPWHRVTSAVPYRRRCVPVFLWRFHNGDRENE